NRRALERRDDANLAGQRRQRPLARRVEKAFALQAFLELIEGKLQRAEPVRLEVLAHELVLALGLVHRDAAPCDDAKTVGRLELQIPERGSKDHGSYLRRAVLQREVEVPGVPDAAVRELAFDPDLRELLLEQVPDLNRELGDREDATRGQRWRVGDRPPAIGRWLSADGRLFRLLLFFKRKIEQVGHRPDPRAPAVRRRSG